jgi:heterokaryon incompatibility protein (HET)
MAQSLLDSFDARKSNLFVSSTLPDQSELKSTKGLKESPMDSLSKLNPLTICSSCEVVLGSLTRDKDYKAFRHEVEFNEFRDSVYSRCFLCVNLSVAFQKLEHETDGRTIVPPVGKITIHALTEKRSYGGSPKRVRFHITQHDALIHLGAFEIFKEPGMFVYYATILERSSYFLESGKITRSWSLESSTRSDSSLDQARRWLTTCVSSHLRCNEAGIRDQLPTRLISLEVRDNIISAKLCEASQLPTETIYCTLSHCWGNVKMFSLTTENMDQCKESIPVSMLVQSFQDAIYVACRLGINNIWIDSLCILQDSLQDWSRESRLMFMIYRNAVCNLAATGFVDGTNGLFCNQDFKRLPAAFRYNEPREEKSELEEGSLRIRTGYILPVGYASNAIKSSPLLRRGWVIQEMVSVSLPGTLFNFIEK